jgi:hypothetical protein
MAEMSMNKAIHRAVRRDLRRFLDATAHFPAGDRARAEELARAWENFHFELTYHHEGEHETAWPALEAVGVSPDLLATLDTEHDAMAAALTETASAMGTLRASASREDAAAAHASIERLEEVTVAHLDHEEAELEPVFQARRDSPEIKAMGKKFAKVSPARAGRYFAWLTDGAGPEEMASIRATVPAPVLKVITGIFGRGYRREIAPVWRGAGSW